MGSKAQKKRTKEVSWLDYLIKNKGVSIPLGFILMIMGLYMYREWTLRRALWKRQIRNM